MRPLPTGDVTPCCVSGAELPIGNTKINTLEDIWNDAPMRGLRRNMLSGEPSVQCRKCYTQEALNIKSMRQWANRTFADHITDVNMTSDDGHHSEFKMRYIDVRFSNICNFSCRICDPWLSSAWWEDAKKLRGDIDHPKLLVAGTDLLEQIIPHLKYTEEIYFAGGEPLLMSEHYSILNYLVDQNLTHIRLKYNTNLSVLTYKNIRVLDLWKHFPNVEVSASLDGSGKHAEYMRKGTRWDDILDNWNLIKSVAPHVVMKVHCTISVMNALHVIDFYNHWVPSMIDPANFELNILTDPEHYGVDILPTPFKEIVRNKAGDNPAFDEMIAYMMTDDKSSKFGEFIELTSKIDSIRDESFIEIFPEFKDYI